jgi:16S rRNA (guanine527-N7)-methyltransferase
MTSPRSSGTTVTVSDLAGDQAHALAITPVSRETLGRLERFVALLLEWQRTTNLISPSTVPQVWTRHIADSLQLLDLAPAARVWVDVGSGGGFPGLAIACALAEKPSAEVHLVESNAKKAAFLRSAVRITETPAFVHAERIESFARHWQGRPDVVCARAVAPLKLLLNQCFSLLKKNGVTALFPKGQNVQAELDEATRLWSMDVTLVPSRTDPEGRIVVIRSLER